jgi:hypothetical protein
MPAIVRSRTIRCSIASGSWVMRHALPACTFFGNDVSGNYCVTRVDTQFVVEASSIASISRLSSFLYPHDNHYAQLAAGSYFSDMAFTDFYGWGGRLGPGRRPTMKMRCHRIICRSTSLPYTINSYIGSNMYTKGNITTPFLDAGARGRGLSRRRLWVRSMRGTIMSLIIRWRRRTICIRC